MRARVAARRPSRGRGQFLAFALIGAGNTAVDGTVFAFIVMVTGWSEPPLAVLVSTLGFLAGAVNSYVWNSRVTFGRTHPGDSFASVGSFLATVSGGAVLAAGAFTLIVSAWPDASTRLATAKLAAIVVTMTWDFSLLRFWVFSAARGQAATL